jgi:hypothetical protein
MQIPEHLVKVILDRFPPPGGPQPIDGDETYKTEGLECYIRIAARLWEILGDGQCASTPAAALSPISPHACSFPPRMCARQLGRSLACPPRGSQCRPHPVGAHAARHHF